MRSSSIVLLSALLFAACSPYDPPAPTPTAIVPDHMVSLRPSRATPVPVTIHAEDLAAGVKVDIATGEVKFKGDFEVRLGDVDLLNVEPEVEDDALILKAEVPGEIEIGTHDLSVTGPGGDGGVLTEAFEVRSIASVELSSSDDSPAAGDRVTLTASILDSAGDPVAAETTDDVVFSLDSGSGSFTTPTLSSGSVRVPYDISENPEEARVRATEQLSGADLFGALTIDTRVTAHRLVLTGPPDPPVAGSATNITAELQDENGSPIPFQDAEDVAFSKVEGRGILGAPLLIGGQILVPYATYRKVETTVVQGEVQSITGIPTAQVSIMTVGGDPVGIELVPGSDTAGAGTQLPLDAYLLDAEGNRSSATAVSDATIAITAGPGTLDAPALFTDAQGVAVVRALYNAENTVGQTVDFSATENVTGSANSATASVEVVAGPVDHFDVLAGAPAYPAGSPFNISLTARDQFDNLADSFNGPVFISDTTGSIAPAISGDFLLGQRTETVIISQTMDDVVIHVEDVDQHAGDSAPFNVVGGGVDHFVIDPIADQVAGASFDVTIRAMDDLSNPVDTYTGAVNISDTTATVTPSVSGVFAAGVRTEPATIFTEHPAVILMVDDGMGHSGTSNPFAVAAGPPTAIVFVSPPQNVLHDTPSAALQVQIQDGFSNPAPVAADTTLNLQTSGAGCFDLIPSGAFDCSITSITVAAGTDLGEFYYLDSADGDKTLTVSDPAAALAPGIQIIKISAFGDPSRIVITQAPASVDADAVSEVFTVQIQDAAGNPVTTHPPIDVDIASSHAEGRFDTDAGGAFDGSITQVRINNGASDATFYYKDTRAGPADIDATEASLLSDTAVVDVLAGPVDRFDFDPIAGQQAGRPFPVLITAYDTFSNIADAFAGTVTLSDLTGTVSPLVSGAFSAGQRTETMTVTSTITVDSLTADDGSGHTGTSNDFAVVSGELDFFAVDTIPSPQNAGAQFQIHIEAKDSWDNIVTNFIGVVNISDSTGTVSPLQSGTFTQGERDENVTVTRATAGTMITVADGAAGHVGVSNLFEVLAGPLDNFAVGPVPAQVGKDAAFDLPLEARDAYDNLVESFTGTVDLADLSGTLQPTVSGAFAGGRRTESVTIGFEMNDDRISADDGSGHTGFSNLFDVTSAQPVVLTAAIEFEPIAVVEGEGFDLKLLVTNEGDYAALAVAPLSMTLGGSGSATLLLGPTPAQTDIPARSQAVFVYRFKTGLNNAGWIDAASQAEGTSQETGLSVQSNTTAGSIPITPASCLLNPVFSNAGGDRQIACGGSATLGGNPTGWGGVPDHVFEWLPDFALDDNTLSNPTANPDINSKYRVTVFDQLGCSATDTAAVTLSDGPTASISMNRQWACDGSWVQFDASGSTGAGPLSYRWELCDGTVSTDREDWHQFYTQQWCPVVLTVTDANGCKATATMGLGVRHTDSESTGPVYFSDPIQIVFADGSSTISITSDHIYECDGDYTNSGREFHVVATRGTITSTDTEAEHGIQVDTHSGGHITVTIRADTRGGRGRLLVTSNRPERDARGSVTYTFSGSTSRPRVVDFGPSGSSDLPPPRFSARFDKPMNPTTATAAVKLTGDKSGPVPGSAYYDGKHRTLAFVPDSLIDPAAEIYTLSIASSASDAWGNQMAAGFEWKFGAVADAVPPTVNCRGESKDPFSPDGDNHDDISELRADLADDTGLALWRIEIFSPEGLLVRTLIATQTSNQNDVKLAWDGHDEDGLLVDNGTYDYRVTAVDVAGNVSTACTNSVTVNSVLDPAEF